MRGDLIGAGGHKPNDLRDLAAFRVQSAQGDVVVTEKRWADVLNRTNVAAMMGYRDPR
jgi:hypothetical protein